MKHTSKRIATIIVCIFLLPLENMAVFAKERMPEPPAYMRELSRLVAATASEGDFGEIRLVIGEPEMEVDGETRPIEEEDYAAPFIDEEGEVQIPVGVIEEADLNGSGFLSEEELEEQGYDVQMNDTTGEITITEPYQQCRLIVKTANGKVKNTYGATHVIRVSNNKTVLQYADKFAAELAAEAFETEADVLFCAPDSICTICASSAATEYKCWGTEVAGADQFMAALPVDLPQVTVAVLDTGADMDHSFLEGRLLDNGWDFVNDDDDPDDDHNHGTHCAGIIRDAAPDNVKILPIKVLDSMGTGSTVLITEGMTFAADSGADILSMSLGGWGDKDKDVFSDAVQYVLEKGASVFAAAGNNGVRLDTSPHYPACAPGVITVAATEKTDWPATFSNYGSMVDVAAPGSSIVSSVRDGKYAAFSGTSMACPLAAACGALLKSEDPTRTPEDLRALLRENARDAYTPGFDEHVGYGIVYLGADTPLERLYLSVSHLFLDQLQSASVYPHMEPAHPSECCMTFSSSDPSVVLAEENGRIRALRGGTATVTVCVAYTKTASYTVTVTGGDAIRLTDAAQNGRMLLTGDGTAWAYGAGGGGEFGYYTGSVDGSPFRYQTAPGEYVTDIVRFLDQGFLKTDGTYWLRGLQNNVRPRAIPIMAVKENGEPLMGVVNSYQNFAFLDDGTVWYHIKLNDPIFQPLCKENGEALMGVMPESLTYGKVVTQDGHAYSFKQTRSGPYASLNFMNPAPYYAAPETINGEPLCNVQQLSSFEVLYRDGTLVRRSDSAVILTDVKEYCGCANDPFSAALKKDGTVWDIATGAQVLKADGTPLTDVVSVQRISQYDYNALCADGTVWAWGYNGQQHHEMSLEEYVEDYETVQSYGRLGIGWNDALYLAPQDELCLILEEKTLSDLRAQEELSENGYSYMSKDGRGSDANSRDSRVLAKPVTRAMQVMVNDDTPLTGVEEVRGSWYIRRDRSVWASGVLRYCGYGGELAEISVYAQPYTLFGEQVYLEKDAECSPRTFRRAEKITVSKPHMAATVGETFTLTATVYPADTYERDIKWQSSNTSVAVVDGAGAVITRKPGFAVIRAYSVSNDKVWGECLLTVEEDAPLKVEMLQYPAVCTFTTTDTFSTSGGLLRVTYANGQVRSLFISPDFCTGYDLTQPGAQTVTVQFAGSTFTYPITVTEAPAIDDPPPVDPPQDLTVTGITWAAYPAVQIGVQGGSFVVPEASIRVLHADNSSEIIPLTAQMCSGYDMQASDTQTVTVTYEGFVLSYGLALVPRISWIHSPGEAKNVYGEPLAVPYASFIYYHDDGSNEIVTLTPELCTGYDPYTYGEQTVTVRYNGEILTFSVMVGLEGVTSIAVETPPEKQCYVVKYDTAPDLTGGTLRVTFADGTWEIVPMAKATMRYQPVWAGATGTLTNTVYLDYGGHTTSYLIYNLGHDRTQVEEAYISKMPDRLVFSTEEWFSYELTGGRIYARTPDGAEGEEDLTLFTAYGRSYGTPTPGEYEFRFKVGNKNVYLTITIVEELEPEPEPAEDPEDDPMFIPPFQLIWRHKPAKTLYVLGEPLDTTGGTFDTLTDHDVTPEMCSGFDPMQPGSQTVTVTFSAQERWYDTTEQTATLTFDVFVSELVLENEVPEIEVGKCTRILATFQPRDVDGREIIWTSSDDSIATVDEYGRVTGIAPGEVEITAQVKGSEAATSCTVTVLPRTVERLPGDADGDGEVTLKDCVQITRYLAGGWDAVIDLINADVNGDGEVNLKDVVILRRCLAGGWSIELQ